jgi:hypothetical protein
MHFVYVENCENMALLDQLKKDRKKAIEDFIKAIEIYATTGKWTEKYIGNKFVELSDEKS